MLLAKGCERVLARHVFDSRRRQKDSQIECSKDIPQDAPGMLIEVFLRRPGLDWGNGVEGWSSECL